LAALVVACQGAPDTTTTTTTAVQENHSAVYFMMDVPTSIRPGPFLVPVARQEPRDDIEAVARALLAGPTEIESAMGISSAIPAGSTLLAVEVEDGEVVVDLTADFASGGGSLSMFARLAQLVYTLTRVAGVEDVRLLIDGVEVVVFSSEGIGLDQPLTREDHLDLRPAILVENPAWGATVGLPIEVTGIAQVFEGTVEYALANWDGVVITEGFTTASAGGPAWGDFSVVLEAAPDELTNLGGSPFDGTLIVWETSAEDGSRINVVEYPLAFSGS
jgi:hypothetical protein